MKKVSLTFYALKYCYKLTFIPHRVHSSMQPKSFPNWLHELGKGR